MTAVPTKSSENEDGSTLVIVAVAPKLKKLNSDVGQNEAPPLLFGW